MRECKTFINCSEIDVEKLKVIEEAAKAVNNFEEYFMSGAEKIKEVSETILIQIEELHPFQAIIEHSWIGHPEIQVNRSILTSLKNDYKIAYLSKPLARSSKINFKFLANTYNWIAVGMCHSRIVEEIGFSFRYHTIGHGVYAVSSNGGIWSHFKPDFNNKLGNMIFSQNETVEVSYDGNSKQVIFSLENGNHLNLDIDSEEKG